MEQLNQHNLGTQDSLAALEKRLTEQINATPSLTNLAVMEMRLTQQINAVCNHLPGMQQVNAIQTNLAGVEQRLTHSINANAMNICNHCPDMEQVEKIFTNRSATYLEEMEQRLGQKIDDLLL